MFIPYMYCVVMINDNTLYHTRRAGNVGVTTMSSPVVVVTLFSNIIHEQNTSNTNLTNKAYPGYCKHVLC